MCGQLKKKSHGMTQSHEHPVAANWPQISLVLPRSFVSGSINCRFHPYQATRGKIEWQYWIVLGPQTIFSQWKYFVLPTSVTWYLQRECWLLLVLFVFPLFPKFLPHSLPCHTEHHFWHQLCHSTGSVPRSCCHWREWSSFLPTHTIIRGKWEKKLENKICYES